MVVSIVRVSQKTFAVPPVVHAVQGETGRVLWMELTDTALTDFDSPFTAGLYFKRSDGTYYNEECMTDPSHNRCEAALDQALTQPGVTKCQLKIEDAAGECSTFDFNIIVHESTSGVSEEQLGYSLEEIREIIDGAESGNQEVEDIRHGYDGVVYPSAGDAVRSQIVQAMENGGGLSNDVKDALLQIAQKVAYIDEDGQTYYDDLYDALYPPATGVTLSASSWGSNTIGETYQLRAIVAPSGWSGTVVWSSSNTAVATVSQTGLVTVVGYGLCIISATADSVSAPCRVSVSQLSVKSISAVFNQGSNKIYDTDDFETEIKKYLTVTATMSDDSTQVLPSSAYGVNTTYLEGASTGSAQAAYNQKTSEWFTFNVTEWLTSLTATYTQSGTVYDTDSLDSLKSDLVVTANYEDGTSATVSDYTLSGTLAEGTSTITVSYGGKTATFSVVVTDPYALPEGYTRYDYVSNTTPASGGVDTGIPFYYCAPEYHHKLKFELLTLPASESGIYGCRVARYGGTWKTENTCWVGASGVLRMGLSGSNNENLFTLAVNTLYELETFHQAISLNGNVLKTVTTSGTYDSSSTIAVWLFAVRQNQAVPETSVAKMTFKIYMYSVEDESGTMIGLFVPCTNSLGIAGFYDLVSQTFKTSTGSGSLTAGND